MLRLFARGWPWLFAALHACEPTTTAPAPAVTPAPASAKCKCPPLGSMQDCSDIRLYMTIGDDRCEPAYTMAGLRCLPKFVYWDASKRYVDTPAGSQLPYPDLQKPPLYVVGIDSDGQRNAITAVWLIPASARRVCTDVGGCVLQVPLSKDALRVPLTWFGECAR